MDLSTADKHRKENNYSEALPLYLAVWEETKSVNAAWGSIHCLRKLKKITDAEKIALQAIEKYPDSVWVKRELVWVIYDKEIKPAKEENDLGRLLHNANRILQLEPEEMPYVLVVKSVIKVAKSRGKWDVVLEWTRKIDPNKLSVQEEVINNRKVMSEREVWYISKVRALYELEKFSEARLEAENGIKIFPDSFFLKRLAALALSKTDISAGLSELRSILNHPRSGWYLKSDIAELSYEDSHTEEAYKLVCESLIDSRQGNEYKLSSFLLLTKLAIELKEWRVAFFHILLSRAVRNQEGWKSDPELEALDVRLRRSMAENNIVVSDIPTETKMLEKLCKQFWLDGVTKGMNFMNGVVKPYPPDKHFTFINTDQKHDDVFVWVRDLPQKCKNAGARVRFTLKKSFDKKKNKETLIAAYISCVE